MKTMIILLLGTSVVLGQSQADRVRQRANEIAKQNAQPKPQIDTALKSADNFRMVQGKLYNVALSTNWITLPGEFRHGKFSRPSADGAVFDLEKQMSKQHGPGLAGSVTWYVADQSVIISNYPAKNLMAGSVMPTIRVYPIGTTADGAAIYDYGTRPQPVTNTLPPVLRGIALTNSAKAN